MRVSIVESTMYAYAMVIVLVGLVRGLSSKNTQIPQKFSAQSRLLNLRHAYGSKPLRSHQKFTVTSNQRRGGSISFSRREVVARQGSLRRDEFHMPLWQRNIPTSEPRSSFIAEYYASPKVTSVHSHIKLRHKKLKHLNVRNKRHIFPPDNRRRISRYQASHRFPYSASVKISTGCTGTLISNQHVLTAAHCIHNKTHFITPTSTIRVGFLKSNGKFRWYGVTSARFPRNEWMNSKGSRHDYAVLRLSKSHKRKFFRLAEASKSSIHIHFSSFPGDKKSNTLWYVDCNAVVLRSSPNIISKCDASKGSSGAGVFTVARRRGKNKRVIVGVLSGATDLLRLPNGRSSYFNNAVSLKAADIRDICRWAGSPRGCGS